MGTPRESEIRWLAKQLLVSAFGAAVDPTMCVWTNTEFEACHTTATKMIDFLDDTEIESRRKAGTKAPPQESEGHD